MRRLNLLEAPVGHGIHDKSCFAAMVNCGCIHNRMQDSQTLITTLFGQCDFSFCESIIPRFRRGRAQSRTQRPNGCEKSNMKTAHIVNNETARTDEKLAFSCEPSKMYISSQTSEQTPKQTTLSKINCGTCCQPTSFAASGGALGHLYCNTIATERLTH